MVHRDNEDTTAKYQQGCSLDKELRCFSTATKEKEATTPAKLTTVVPAVPAVPPRGGSGLTPGTLSETSTDREAC